MKENVSQVPESASPIWIGMKSVERLLSLSRSTIYRFLDADDNDFPRPLKIGGKVQFVAAEVHAWAGRQQSLRRLFAFAFAGGAI